MYVCLKSMCFIMENETYTLEHELENSTQITEHRRKRDPYRGIGMLNYNKAKKTLPLSRNRQVYFSCMFEKRQKKRVLSMCLRLAPARTSRRHGFLSLLLLEDYINTSTYLLWPVRHTYTFGAQTYIHTYMFEA